MGHLPLPPSTPALPSATPHPLIASHPHPLIFCQENEMYGLNLLMFDPSDGLITDVVGFRQPLVSEHEHIFKASRLSLPSSLHGNVLELPHSATCAVPACAVRCGLTGPCQACTQHVHVCIPCCRESAIVLTAALPLPSRPCKREDVAAPCAAQRPSCMAQSCQGQIAAWTFPSSFQ